MERAGNPHAHEMMRIWQIYREKTKPLQSELNTFL